MILRLSDDRSRALAITGRYFKLSPNVDVKSIDKSALACRAQSILEKKINNKATKLELLSPAITMVPGALGYVLLSSHPDLGGELRLIPPSQFDVPQGWLTVVTGRSLEAIESLPYHFRVSVLAHGHRNG